MSDRTVRTLEHLDQSASTARVLNLYNVRRTKSSDPDYLAKPLFQNPALNSCIILKHRLRHNELEEFTTPRQNATKVLVPLHHSDLRMGARYVFVGQRNFEAALHQAFGIQINAESRDLKVLAILDESPTLDPFVLREKLRLHGIDPALCYFDLSAADTRRIFAFAQTEIEPLVRMSAQGAKDALGQAAKLTRKILADSADADLDPLRRTLQLDPQQFQEGVFCWKAFLYYKWQLADLLPRVNPVLQEIKTVRPRGPADPETKLYLSNTREVLHKALMAACRQVRDTLSVYDNAYHQLTANSDPSAFRQFLLKAPELFNELGERLGAVEHLVSFWRFRFPVGKPPMVTPDDLADLFQDFEASLGFSAPESSINDAQPMARQDVG
ncbi:MAG TPA: hypothetical protein VMU59_05140 [Caulobacteraceae bacterium]|nr:hypothetical protein [Caulobacteraceae bacterium]